MLRPFRHSQPWIPRGYVCRSCRHHLHSTRRRDEDSHAAAAAAGAEEDWFSNFNDLDPRTPKHDVQTREGDGRDNASKTASEKPRATSGSVRSRSRRLSAEASAIAQMGGYRTAELKVMARKYQQRLSAAAAASVDAPATAKKHKTAFTRMDEAYLRSQLGMLGRVIELRVRGKLKEPDMHDSNKYLPLPSATSSDEELERDLGWMKMLLKKRLSESENGSSNPGHRISAEESARYGLPSFQQFKAAHRKPSRIRARIEYYEKILEQRRNEELPRTKVASTEQHQIETSGENIIALLSTLDELVATHGKEFPSMKDVTPKLTPSSASEIKKEIGILKNTLCSRRAQSDREQAGTTKRSTFANQPKVADTDGQSENPGLDALVADLRQQFTDEVQSKNRSTGTASLDSVRKQLDEDSLTKFVASSGHTDIGDEPLQTSNDEAPSSDRSALRTSMPGFAASPEDSSFHVPKSGQKPKTIMQRVREIKARPKWGGVASKQRAGSNDSIDEPPLVRRQFSGGSKHDLAQEEQASAELFGDSPAELAELQMRGGMIEPERKQDMSSTASSKESGLGDLKQKLAAALENRDRKRAKSIEQNIRAYEQRSETFASQSSSAGAGDAFESLAKLHAATEVATKDGNASVAKDKTPEAVKEEKDDAAKPAKSGGRKRHRSVRAEKKRSGSTKAPSSTTNDADDGGEHQPLWKVMQNSKSEPAETSERPAAVKTEAKRGVAHAIQAAPSSDVPPSIASVKAGDLHIDALDIPQPPVPALEYGLGRVLFNPGVYQLQDPTSRVYNFDPYLQHIMPAVDFDFNALKEYKTSSEDKALSAIAKEHQKRYIGSTSSMTSTLAHFHYLLSNWRTVNLDMLSRGFTDQADEFTRINRAPNAIFLRWKPESRTYAIDADKEYDGANVLMMLGKSMEKMLTLPTSDFEKYRKSDPREVPQEARDEPEAFQYTTMGDFLMRSQLDAYDSRLPGTGMFDLKTRAVLPVRMDAEDYEPMLGYEIHTLQGRFNSYEREYYDMIRSTMLKYMLQARMGRMQGIFAAYHNIERIFGFQYISIMDMDRALHGQIDPCLGDQEFKLSLDMLNKVLDKATAKFPEQSLRLHFETTEQALGGDNPTPVMSIFAEPMAENEINRIQSLSKEKVKEFERNVMGIEEKGANEQAPTEYPPATPEPDSEEPTGTIEDSEKGEDQAPTEYPPATPEPPKQAAKDQAPTEYPPGTPEPNPETPETSEPEPAEDSVPTTYPPVTPEPPSTSSSNPDLTSSTSAADSKFLSSLATNTTDFPPLFAATLMTKSRVNGSHVPRPSLLKPDDDWTVEYLLTDYPESESTWARYQACKGRRKEIFSKERDEDEDVSVAAENGKGKKKNDGYFVFLREMAKRGREFRTQMNAVEKGKEKKFAWRVEGGKAEMGGVKDAIEPVKGSEVRDVGEYMGWLYEERERKE